MTIRNTTVMQASFIILCFLLLTACANVGINTESVMLTQEKIIPFTEEITKGTLENGLSYFILSNSEPEKRASFMMIVNSGSALENETNLGVAHFIEHMAFNGTENFPGKGIDEFMASIGMGTCECYSGRTNLEETIYDFFIPTDNIDTIDRTLLVLSDIANGISFIPDEIEKERGVIIEEWRKNQGFRKRNARKVQNILYKGSIYEERLGLRDIPFAETLGVEMITDFYKSWYNPEQIAIIAVGDFNQSEVEGLIKKRFAHLKKKGTPPTREFINIPERNGTDFVILSDPETSTYYINILLLHDLPYSSTSTVSSFEKVIAEYIAIRLLNERLDARLYEETPPYRSASLTSSEISGRNQRALSLSFSADDDQIDSAMEATLNETGRILRDGFAQSELDRISQLLTLSLDELEKQEDDLHTSILVSELKRHYLTGEPVPGGEFELQFKKSYLSTISLADINAAISRVFSSTNRMIIAVSPEGKESDMPNKDRIISAFDNMQKTDAGQYVDTIVNDELRVSLPEKDAITSETEIDIFEAYEWELSNGATVVLKPMDIDKNEVLFEALSLGGHSVYEDADYFPAIMAPYIVAGGGIGQHDARSLDHYLMRKRVSISPFVRELTEGFTGGCPTQEIETLLKLVYLYFTDPKKDETYFQNLKADALKSVIATGKKTDRAFIRAFEEAMYQNHPRRSAITKEMVEALDIDNSMKIFKDRFSDASDFTFFLVGDFDIEKIRPLVNQYLGNLPSTYSNEQWRDIGVKLPRGVIEKEVRSGNEGKATVAIIFNGSYEWNQRNNLEFDSLSYVLDNALRASLREELSGTYDVSVSSDNSRIPHSSYKISVRFDCDPKKVDFLISNVFRVIESLKRGENISPYLEAFIKKTVEYEKVRKEDNTYWLNLLSYCYFNNISPEDYEYPDVGFEDIRVDNIAEAASRFLDLNNYVKIKYYSDT